jgi:hypothetical protein
MRFRAVIWRLAHFASPAYVALAIIYPLSLLSPWDGLQLAIVTSVILGDVALVSAVMRHERVLCGICASMTPLDGTLQADRHDGALRRYHNRWFPAWGTVLLLFAIAVSVTFNLPDLVIRLGNSASLLCSALVFSSWNAHRLLAPWCRYCRRPWEDDGDPEPSPNPDPSSTKQLPV